MCCYTGAIYSCITLRDNTISNKIVSSFWKGNARLVSGLIVPLMSCSWVQNMFHAFVMEKLNLN